MLKELSVFICSKVAGLTIGGNVQVGYRAQDAPVRCHAFIESGGGIPAFGLPDRIDYLLQIVTRAATYQTARDDAWAVFNAINGTAGWRIAPLVSGGQAYIAQTIEALAAPQGIGQDATGAFELSTNFLFRMIKA